MSKAKNTRIGKTKLRRPKQGTPKVKVHNSKKAAVAKPIIKNEDLIGRYFAFYKPYGYLSQFTKDSENQLTLHDFNLKIPKDVYPVGRLDKDSEGLLLLSNNKRIVEALLNPKQKKWKTYWVQVDGDINKAATKELRNGVTISVNKKQHKTLPSRVKAIVEPEDLHDRKPPVRFRANIPTSWIEISICEGKNRQIRKMCSKVGFPVLRLIRVQIGHLKLKNFRPANLVEIKKKDLFGEDADTPRN